jgi:hypothetical protein
MTLIRRLCSVALAAVGPIALAADAPASTDLDAPEMTFRVNGHSLPSAEPLELTRGEPVIAEVILSRADQSPSTPLSLDPPAGGWASRVKIAVTDAGGKSATWPFVVTGKPSAGALALQPDATTTLVLRLEPAALGALINGSYVLAARLDLADGRGWRGTVVSDPAAVKVVEPIGDPTAAVLGDRQLLRVRDALLANDLPRAEAAATAMMQADLKRPEGFVGMALVAEAKGDGPRAVLYIDMAIARAAGEPAVVMFPTAATPAPPPFTPDPVPFEYLDLRRRFEQLPATEPESPDTKPASGSPHA